MQLDESITADSGEYVDWSTQLPGGGRQFEVGDADGHTVQIDLGPEALRELHLLIGVTLARIELGR